MDEASDEDVAVAFGGGQPDALTLVYERFGRLVYSIALRSLGTRPDAEDVTQQVFVSAWRSRDTLHAPRRPGFYEVWLLARDGISMISLGDLNAGHTGTFTVPPGTDLRDY